MVELSRPDASTATKVTSASPIINAAAVAAVLDWVSSGVGGGQPAHGATEPASGHPDDEDQRRDEATRDHRDADEEQQHPARGGDEHRLRAAAGEDAGRDREHCEHDHDAGDVGLVPVEASDRKRGAFAHGGDRRDTRCPQRREEAGEQRDAGPERRS